MQNFYAAAMGVIAAGVASVLLYKFVMPMRLMEMNKQAERQGRELSTEEVDRVKKFFRFGVPAAVTASFTISAIYMIGDVQ